MKAFVAFSALLAVASASHLYLAPSARLIVPAPSSQYHSQDGIGQYVYGYNDHLSTKQEVKSFDGTTRGSYSYIDSNNILQTVDYTADAGGFRVAATNLPKSVEAPIQDLPQQVVETSEVAAAKSAHLAAVEEAKKQIVMPAPIELPRPVEDTPEVAAAKAVHLAAIEDAKKQIGYQYVASPAPIELPRQVEDTPEVVKAKAEHLIAIEQAKLRNSFQTIDSGVSFVQSAPAIASQLPLLTSVGSLPLPSQGFSYSSSVVNAPLVDQLWASGSVPLSARGYSYSPSVVSAPSVYQLSTSGSVPLPAHGFSYSSSVVNAPVSQYAYAPYVNYQV